MLKIALDDLEKSGLEPSDIQARMAEMPENAALKVVGNAEGYVIPYFGMDGKYIPFFRTRYFGQAFKYKQPANNSNHLYFPPGFHKLLVKRSAAGGVINIVICEGEKKAACAVKQGILAAALGGVDSWRNRTIVIPGDAEISSTGQDTRKTYSVKIAPGSELETSASAGPLAHGLRELVDMAIIKGWHITIIFDTDMGKSGVKPSVQRAAATLGYELVSMGLAFDHVHQHVIPATEEEEKIGLDDYLVAGHAAEIGKQLQMFTEYGNGQFPLHPNVKVYVSKQLSRRNISRNDMRKLALAVLADMQARGKRIRSLASGEMFYFDKKTRSLMECEFVQAQKGQMHATPFGRHLFKVYGLAADDSKLLTVLHALFESVEPIEETNPHRIICRPGANEDIVRYQINDGQYVSVDGSLEEPLQLLDNGSNGILFESGHMDPMDGDELMRAFKSQKDAASTSGKIPMWWKTVIDDTRITQNEESRKLTALLFYMSPWLNKWRGMQIPIEIVLGEAGSGKSSMYEHRLNVMTGYAQLRNAPAELKDWHASVASSGGLHVIDNTVLADKSLRQRLSDELCRLVTEPDPHIEMRKLYSNGKLIRLPITTNFAFTAIQQPFLNADVLQRSIIIEMHKAAAADDHGQMSYDAFWVPNQMTRFGGREAWIAHHMVVLNRFFQLVKRKWNMQYPATYRLINVEQALMLFAEVFGMDPSWIPKYLTGTTRNQISSGDWALEGITAYAKMMYKARPDAVVSAGVIVDWASASEEYADCAPLLNSRKLGRYLATNEHLVREVCGLVKAGKQQNKVVYRIEPRTAWKSL